MKDSIHKYFQIGTIQWMSHPTYDVLDSIYKIACDDFFDALEITQFKNSETRAKALKMLNSSHLRICYGAQPRLLGPKLNPNSIIETERKKAESTLLEAIDEAKELGAEGIAFLSGQYSKENKEKSYEQLLKTTRKICDYAEQQAMMIELEVFDYDIDKKALIGPAPYAAKFAADMRMTNSNFGLLVDLSHFPITHEQSQFVIRTCRPYITHLHIGNAVAKMGCEAYGDQHPRFGFPNGENDTAELLEFFRVIKLEGFLNANNPMVLSFEVKPWGGENADIVLANTKRVINRAWALLED